MRRNMLWRAGAIARVDHSGDVIRIVEFTVLGFGVVVESVRNGGRYTEPVINLVSAAPLEELAAQAD